MIDALLQLSTLVVGQVARDAATQHLLSGTAQTGFKLAQHRAGGNQNEPIAPLPGYPLVEVIRKLSGKAGALFGMGFGMWLKLSSCVPCSTMALARCARRVVRTGRADHVFMWLHEIGQLGEGVIRGMALEAT